MARVTGLEPATSGVTGRHSNQLSYTRAWLCTSAKRERWIKLFPPSCQALFRRFCYKPATIFRFLKRTVVPGKNFAGPASFSLHSPDEAHKRCQAFRRAVSSAGRAPRLHRGCREFESLTAHHCSSVRKAVLRTIDAPVMPKINSADTNAATFMIAEKASAMIRQG